MVCGADCSLGKAGNEWTRKRFTNEHRNSAPKRHQCQAATMGRPGMHEHDPSVMGSVCWRLRSGELHSPRASKDARPATGRVVLRAVSCACASVKSDVEGVRQSVARLLGPFRRAWLRPRSSYRPGRARDNVSDSMGSNHEPPTLERATPLAGSTRSLVSSDALAHAGSLKL